MKRATKSKTVSRRASMGRPAAHPNERSSKITVVLLDRQVAYLDRLGAEAREKQGVSLQRAEIIRALIDALQESGADVTAVDLDRTLREENLKKLFRSEIGKRR